MRGTRYGTAVAVGFILMISTPIMGQSGMMGPGAMEPPGSVRESPPRGRSGMMGMMEGGGMGGHRDLMEPGPMLRMLTTELALSEGQEKQLKDILYQVEKTHITQRADVRVAELELQQLLEADPVDMGQVESKLKDIEGLRTALRLQLIKAHEQAKGVLSPEQRQQFERIHDRLHGMHGMMGGGGMGRMEMMGPEMKSGMAGGGMGGQAQRAQAAAGTPQPLTREDTQGGVTVRATLLTPDKPRPDGTLAMQLTLDTHAVDLDPYALETLAVLRDSRGREVPALGFESPSGGGHHREGVLSFPGTDARGQPLLSPEATAVTLIVRGIGGVPERVFQWPLGAGARHQGEARPAP
jgi:Spy/CpxP family protein refolding chaperone